MRAVQIDQIGGPEVMRLVDVPVPEPRPGQVRVKVEAAGLNYSDIMIREGRYLQKTEPPTLLGREFCGVVVALGEGVTAFQVGDRVVGTASKGAFADEVVVRAEGLTRCPAGMSPEVAVSMLVQGITAIHCLDDCGRVQPGETVLIHAAAGGVGTLAIQLARLRGARVIGTASSDEKCALIRELGGEALNYTHADWVAELKNLTGGKGAEVILESVGGEIFLRSFREALAPLGRLVVFGAASGEVAKLPNVEILGASKAVIGYFLPVYYSAAPRRVSEASGELVRRIQDGTLKPIVGKVFSLDEVVEAFNFMQSRASVGKVIIKP